MLNPPKKDTPHPETKEKPQQDRRRGTIMIKSNPKPTGLAAHKLENDNTKEVLPLLWKFWAPTSGFPAQGSGKGTGNTQGIRLWRPAGFDCRTSTGLGETDSTFGGHKQILCTPGPKGKKQWPHGRLNQTYLLVLEGLLWRRGLAVAHCGDRGTGSSSPGRCPLVWALLEFTISPTIEP